MVNGAQNGLKVRSDKLKNLQNCVRGACFYTSEVLCKIAPNVLTKALDASQNVSMLAQDGANMTQ